MEQATWLVGIILCLSKSVISGEDCTTVKPVYLPHLSERIVGYKLQGNEVPICDAYIDAQWYNFTYEFAITRSTNHCGTDYNWYLKDPLPSNGQSVNLTVCRYENENQKCPDEKIIKGMKCNKEYYFYLRPLDGCNEAYCIENTDPNAVKAQAPDISILKPIVESGVLPVGETNNHEVQFYCDITPPQSFNYYYVVEWSLHTGLALVSSLTSHMPYQYVDRVGFRSKTALTERHLKLHGIFHPGFMISCSVKAQQGLNGYFSHPQKSAPKYFGLQIVNNTGTTILVKDGDKVTLQAKLTIPFGCSRSNYCSLSFRVVIPQKDTNCMISRLSSLESESISRCGIAFSDTDVEKGTIKEFTITAKFGSNQLAPQNMVYNIALITNLVIRNHEFFQRYTGASIRVALSVAVDKLQNKRCSSTSDPHLYTFDGSGFDNHNKGTYIMYRHKDLQVEVQTKGKECWNAPTPLCNCGVAVRAGRDIFLVDRCGKQTTPASTVLCDDGVLNGKILKQDGVFKIFLPTGTVVEFSTDSIGFLAVTIYPSLVDYKKTEGLCGLFDENRSNDIIGDVTSFISSWKVKPSEDLFNRTNYINLSRWRDERYWCECDNPNETNGELTGHAAVCDTGSNLICADDYSKKNTTQDLCNLHISKRRRRSSDNSLISGHTFDGYTSPKTAYFKTPKLKPDDVSFKRPVLMRRAVKSYNNITARIDCLEMMNTTVFQMCNTVSGLNFDNFIDNCVDDALMSQSMDWTWIHLESIKQKCIHYVDAMQPIPPEILAEINYDPSSNSTNTTNSIEETSASTPAVTNRPVLPVITPKLLSTLKTISCTNECSGNGLCINGTCLCNEPFISFDCSINKTMPPEMIGIPDEGICDLSLRACAKTSVLGSNFAEESSLTCRLEPFQVERNGSITYEEETKTIGLYESMDEIYCHFPQRQHRSKRSTTAPSDDYISRGYFVSVSNDGIEFSDSDSVVIFDSTCVDCHKELDKIVCSTKPNYCMHDGMCYSIGEEEGCYMCVDTTPSHVGWIAGPECSEPVIPAEEKKLWIIGAVLGPFAIFAVVTTATLCYIGKRKQLARAKVGSLTDM